MSSALVSSCLRNHSCRNSSLSRLSCSSLSLSGRKEVSTLGFFLTFFTDGSTSREGVFPVDSSPSSPSSSTAKDSLAFAVFFLFFAFFCSSLNASPRPISHLHHIRIWDYLTYLSSSVFAASRAFNSSNSFLLC